MDTKKDYSRYCDFDLNQHCNNIANQYLILVSIYAAIISQEIENDEDLGILGSFLVALGEELSLASELRIACRAKFEEENTDFEEIEDVFDRGLSRKSAPSKKSQKKYIKKIRKKYNKKRL